MVSLLVVLGAVVFSVALVLFPFGVLTTHRANAQTAADAAALAGAAELHRQIASAITPGMDFDDWPPQLDTAGACDRARGYASRNGATVEECQRQGLTMVLQVRNDETPSDGWAQRLGVAGERARADARARVGVRLTNPSPLEFDEDATERFELRRAHLVSESAEVGTLPPPLERLPEPPEDEDEGEGDGEG